MVHIRNGNDLRTAYGILRDMQGLAPLRGREAAVVGHIRQTSILRKRKRPDVRIILVDEQGGHIHAGTG